MTKDELRRKNHRLREKIDQILLQRPELRDVIEVIAFRQDMHVQVGTPFLERVQGKLQERARAIMNRRLEREHYFDERSLTLYWIESKHLVPAHTQDGFELKWFLQTKSGGRSPPEGEP
jgi:hypothetical protein